MITTLIEIFCFIAMMPIFMVGFIVISHGIFKVSDKIIEWSGWM